MKFYYSKYGRANSSIGCGTVLKEDDWDDLINGDYLCMGMGSLLTFPKNIKNVYSLNSAFHNCGYLKSFGNIGGDDKTFNNCYNLSWAFAGTGMSDKKLPPFNFDFIFPVATRIDCCFIHCYNAVAGVGSDSFPEVKYGRSAFEETYFENFGTSAKPINFPELRCGMSMFYDSRLKNAYINLPKLLGGHLMFSKCKLNHSSLQYIVANIRNLNTNPPITTGDNAEINNSGHILIKIHNNLKNFLNSGKKPEDIESDFPNYFTTVTDKYYGVITIGYDSTTVTDSQKTSLNTAFNNKGWTVTWEAN